LRIGASPVSSVASFLLIASGALVLVGWQFDLQILTSLTGQITMKANAALGLLSSGVALVLVGATSRGARLIGQLFGVLAGLIGTLTLSEHIVGWNLGIDELLFSELPGAAATTSPGRMGPNTSTSLTLGSIALCCLYRSSLRAIATAQLLAACMAILALVPIAGYMYGATELYAIAKYTGIAAHTGVALLILSVGLLAARSNVGPMAALTTRAAHGVMARRLLVVAFVVPPLFGFFRVEGQARGWYDTGLGAALFVVSMMVLLSITIWRTAGAMGRTDAELAQAALDREALLVRERAARRRAEGADRAKDDFIAALSHELRTPLNAILGWMIMLQQHSASEAARTRATNIVLRNAGVLARLIEDLLDTSRITTGHLVVDREPVDPKMVVQAAVESVQPTAESSGVVMAVVTDPPVPMIMGDAQRLQQVVSNLLSNAIKFSPSGGRVEVHVAMEGETLEISVWDEGEGIDPAFLPHAFERLRQADTSTTRAQGGLGLGLYLARHLTLLHGGTLTAESPGLGQGSVFTIRLPAGADIADGNRITDDEIPVMRARSS
jgi:signal transduction histidine kinase